MDNCFPKSARLLKSKDYQRVYQAGKRKAGRFLKLFYCCNQLDHCRFGISVSKRFGKAVQRNLLKRRIREGIRSSKSLLAGWDVVVHPRLNAEVGSGFQIASDLADLLKLLGQRKEIGIGKAKHSQEPSSL
ncbi:MAG: ribonuclease P protein component [Acidobacteria bacterium]|nr:ribonuclease P protein component [Acidobacteriota bacterium]